MDISLAECNNVPAGVRLHVDAPLCGVEPVGLQGALLTEQLRPVDVLIAAIIPQARPAFRVLVGHRRPQRLNNRLRREVLGGNKLNTPPAEMGVRPAFSHSQ